MIHELKIKPKFFQDIINGIKNFEIRKNDRMFRVGDILVLSEFDYMDNTYTGNQIKVKVDNILTHDDFPDGIPIDYVVMNIRRYNSWIPVQNDIYYRIDIDGDIVEDTWEETTFDYAVLMIGNCFESKVQAAKYKNYYVHLYKGYQNEKYKRN